MRRAYFLASALLLAACGDKSGDTPTEQEKRVIETYASLSLLNSSFSPTTAPDSVQLYGAKADSVLRSHGLTREEFQSEMEKLSLSPERFQRLFQEIHARLQKQPPAGNQ